ncbi:DUF6520 family protein [Salegentibacter agarivorans]|nr:DUF6520 family protein [Salegentibacter agarivorans]
MKFRKLILPMMAFIFAIGLTFATVDSEPKLELSESDSYATMYVNIGNNWYPIEVECGIGDAECRVSFEEDPSPGASYKVYNSEDLGDPAIGVGGIKSLEGFPPTD